MSLVDWEVWKSKVVCRYNEYSGLVLDPRIAIA